MPTPKTFTKPTGKPAGASKAKAAEKPLAEVLREAVSRPMPRSIAMALLIALVISGLSIVLVNQFDGAAKMRHWVENAGAWAPLVYIGLKAATYLIAPLSGTPVALAGGALFGFWDGALYVLAGDTLGATINFWIARLFRERGIKRFAPPNTLQRIDELTDSVGGWRALVAARLFLKGLYDFVSYAAGLSNLSFKQFFWVSLLAGIPATVFTVWIGNAAVTNNKFLYISFGVSAVALLIILFTQRGAKNTPAGKP